MEITMTRKEAVAEIIKRVTKAAEEEVEGLVNQMNDDDLATMLHQSDAFDKDKEQQKKYKIVNG